MVAVDICGEPEFRCRYCMGRNMDILVAGRAQMAINLEFFIKKTKKKRKNQILKCLL